MASRQDIDNFIARVKASNTLGRFDPDGFVYDGQGKRIGYERKISDEDLVTKVGIYLDQSNNGLATGVRNAPSALVVGHIDNPILGKLQSDITLGNPDMSNPEHVADIKQEMRRKEAAHKLAMGLTVNRVAPGASSNLVYISLEQFSKLQEAYAAAKESGVSDSNQEFLPFSTYAAKFVQAQIPLLEGELGRFQSQKHPKLNGKVAVLRDKDFSINTTVIGPSKRVP